MDRLLEIFGWVVVAIIGIVLWSVFPEVRTILACLLTATLIHRVFVAAVRLTARRLVSDELMELRLEISSIVERLEHIDRKTNALHMNALAQRQAATLRNVANNLQQSWRFDGEPPKAVLRDFRTIDWIWGRLRSSTPSGPAAGRPFPGS